MNEWQPIETAPKDGTSILGYNETNDSIHIAKWNEKYEWVTGDYDNIVVSLTLWFPLPEPPKKKHECHDKYSRYKCVTHDGLNESEFALQMQGEEIHIPYCPFCGEKA